MKQTDIRVWHIGWLIAPQRYVRSWVQTGNEGHAAKDIALTPNGHS